MFHMERHSRNTLIIIIIIILILNDKVFYQYLYLILMFGCQLLHLTLNVFFFIALQILLTLDDDLTLQRRDRIPVF